MSLDNQNKTQSEKPSKTKEQTGNSSATKPTNNKADKQRSLKEKSLNLGKKIKKSAGSQNSSQGKPDSSQQPKQPTSKRGKKSAKIPQGVYFMGSPKMNSFINIFLVLLIAYSLFNVINGDNPGESEISLSELAAKIESGAVTELEVDGGTITALTTDDDLVFTTRKENDAAVTDTLINYGVSTADLRNVPITVQAPSALMSWFGFLAPILIPLIIIIAIFVYLSKQMKGGGGMQPFNFGQSRARMIDPKDPRKKITFADVAGVEEAKEELQEIVHFLKTPKKFLDIGAQIPKGVLLMGAPGTGKTLLARAVAGEAGVPFFSISGSEFVEMFVGVGASRVRDLFKMAKKVAPAIIFIDEIDAVGRSRGVGTGGGNDEREQTLNQILVEMDGFEPNQTVIIMAATNRPDVLDPALLRPGRFDRRVTVDSPDRKGRVMILEIQAQNKPLADDVDFNQIAERTPGFTGADIYSLVNEAAILAARHNKKKIDQADFISAIEKVMLGPERRSHLLTDQEKRVTAYHEAGHAVVSAVMDNTDPVHKITIVSRGRALGYVLSLPTEDKKLRTRKQFRDIMAMALGGYVTEQLIFDDLSTGPSNDLEKVTANARAMVTRYGMSEDIGPIALETEAGSPLYGAKNNNEYSEEVAKAIDFEVSRLINEAQKRALEAITKNRQLLDEIAELLIEQETIEREEFNKLAIKHGLQPKQETPHQPGVIITD